MRAILTIAACAALFVSGEAIVASADPKPMVCADGGFPVTGADGGIECVHLDEPPARFSTAPLLDAGFDVFVFTHAPAPTIATLMRLDDGGQELHIFNALHLRDGGYAFSWTAEDGGTAWASITGIEDAP